jgi:hypothetical protein
MITAEKTSSLSLINFLICGGGILIFGVFALYPNQRALNSMDAEIRKMTAHIEEQEAMFPLFEELMKITNEKKSDILPFPEKMLMERNDIGKISSQIKDIAQLNRLSLEEITPDVNTLIDDSGHLRMYLKTKGKFFDFRQFMIGIGGIPYLEHTEQLQIRTIQGSEDVDITLKIWLARE